MLKVFAAIMIIIVTTKSFNFSLSNHSPSEFDCLHVCRVSIVVRIVVSVKHMLEVVSVYLLNVNFINDGSLAAPVPLTHPSVTIHNNVTGIRI